MAITDKSHVSAARQAVGRITRATGFDDTGGGRAAIVVTEAVTNMIKHAQGGLFIAQPIEIGAALGIEMLAIDKGPGMGDFEASAIDGHSTVGTQGTGLGAMRRQSDEFEVYTRRDGGTIVRSLLWAAAAPAAFAYDLGAVCVPKTGETVCGDAWGAQFAERGATFVLADGLGHGPDASRASALAVDALQRHAREKPERLMDRVHAALRPTRGAAVALIHHDVEAAEAAFCGVGNVAAWLIDAATRRAMVSTNGIVGHNVARLREFRYPWKHGALLVAHTDGIDTHWDLAAYPGLSDCHPSIIAAMLLRQHSRGRDDAGVLVARVRH